VRIFAVSDLHVEYAENDRWVGQLSGWDYKNDVLVCAGDLAHHSSLVAKTLERLRSLFLEVLYVPGNHELWMTGPAHSTDAGNSLEKFHSIRRVAAEHGVHTEPLHLPGLSLVPLFAWYDFSFGLPTTDLLQAWADFHRCSWPERLSPPQIAEHFLSINEPYLQARESRGEPVISVSHFVPRLDLLSNRPWVRTFLAPVLGSELIEKQVRQLGSFLHIYGHYHRNGRTEREQVTYINNALGYPSEKSFLPRELVCAYEIET